MVPSHVGTAGLKLHPQEVHWECPIPGATGMGYKVLFREGGSVASPIRGPASKVVVA